MNNTGFAAIYRTVWQKNFPRVILNAPLGSAAKHVDFQLAKTGDVFAAVRLVNDTIHEETIAQLEKIIGNKKPLLVPVHAEEAISINEIPVAYAATLGMKFDLNVELNIVQSAKVSRTGSDGFSRLAFPPPFSGEPSNYATHAIIIDDTLTQGGTLANLRGYLAQFEIETITATTLTGKNYSSILAITNETLNELRDKYDELEKWWNDYFGYGFDCLTESEARYIVKSGANADTIRDRIITERQKRIGGKGI
jgi:hypoxanthine-guanine phosphoribosyltransferase